VTPAAVVSAEQLQEFAERVLAAVGVSRDKARLAASVLVYANLRGVDSHGVQALPHYVGQIEAGDVNPAADGHVVTENGACLLYDGEHGLGSVAADACSAHAIRLAREHGVAMAVARETGHFGAAAFWAQKISAAGLAGIVMCDASPQVPPWQGKAKRVGTNPIAMSVPHPQGRGWLLDMATSGAALGKLEQARLNGASEIPAGWALDSEGRPTTSLDAALAGFLMPLGGYKGSGLALMVEILSGVVGGGAMAPEIRNIRDHGRPARSNHTFLAIDVARFLPLEAFYARMGQVIEYIKATPVAAGYAEVLVAGDPEWRMEDERRANGIPILPGPWDVLAAMARRLGVALPASIVV
jgi:LDH2 family malate/lactate/ureidoglycolate dehydrogenase